MYGRSTAAPHLGKIKTSWIPSLKKPSSLHFVPKAAHRPLTFPLAVLYLELFKITSKRRSAGAFFISSRKIALSLPHLHKNQLSS